MPGSKIGIRTVSFVPAAVTTISNTVLATIAALSFPVAANTTWWMRFTIPISTGATGGAKFQIVAPTVSAYLNEWAIYLGGSPGTLADTAVQTASASFANALAAATNHIMTATCFLTTTAAGTVGLQFAQNSSVASTLTILPGGIMEVYQM